MVKLIKQWWEGKTMLIDDGGYVPRLVEQRPLLRVFYDTDKTGFWSVITILMTPLWVELLSAIKSILVG